MRKFTKKYLITLGMRWKLFKWLKKLTEPPEKRQSAWDWLLELGLTDLYFQLDKFARKSPKFFGDKHESSGWEHNFLNITKSQFETLFVELDSLFLVEKTFTQWLSTVKDTDESLYLHDFFKSTPFGPLDLITDNQFKFIRWAAHKELDKKAKEKADIEVIKNVAPLIVKNVFENIPDQSVKDQSEFFGEYLADVMVEKYKERCKENNK